MITTKPRRTPTGWTRWGMQCALLVAALGLASAPRRAEALLSNPGACSSTMIDMMTDGMVFVYMNTAWACLGFCDQAMGVFFMEVLESKPLTLQFMDCAEANPELIDVMIRITSRNPEVLERMSQIMSVDCDFPARFVSMATWHLNLRGYFFYAIDDGLYTNLTRAMLCEPPDIVRGLGGIMQDDLQTEFQQARPFFEAVMNLQTPTNASDGNEMAAERMLYAFMRDTEAAASLFDAMQTLDPREQGFLLDFMFLGKTNNRAGEVTHPDQRFYNTYAMVEAFASGVAPSYDPSLPPDASSTNPANALLGRMLQLFLITDASGNITGLTPHAIAFFEAVRSAAEVHCDPYAIGMMQLLGGLFPPALLGQLPPASTTAPSPRDFKVDGAPLSYTCPPPPPMCAPATPEVCDETGCAAQGLNWCNGACQVAACPPSCDAAHPELCPDEASCIGAGLSWCNGACEVGPCPTPSVDAGSTSPDAGSTSPDAGSTSPADAGSAPPADAGVGPSSSSDAGPTEVSPSNEHRGCTHTRGGPAPGSIGWAMAMVLAGLLARRRRG